jgi:hypothetical protein
MYDHNQLFVADSFAALYVLRERLTLTRKELETRYETCEDLAGEVARFCQTLQFGHGLSEEEALRRCHQGLLEPPTAVSEAEAAWVICRVAEMLSWDLPEWLAHALAAATPKSRR